MAAVYITHLATVTSVSVPLGGMARTVNWKMHLPCHTRKRMTIVTVTVVAMENVYQVILIIMVIVVNVSQDGMERTVHSNIHFPGHTRKRVTIVTVTVVAMENVYQVIMHSDRCQCDSGWHGTYCTQQYTSKTTKKTTTSTTTTTTTTTTSTVAPTTTVPTTTSAPFTAAPIFYRCNHVSTIVAVAYQTPVSNPNASICAHGQQASHEAFVLTECDVPTTPATWKQGVNVMSRCASSNPIPYDTPIASFDHGLYSSAGSLSGVFLGCTSDGFKIAFQTCGQAPEMTELLQGHHFSQNPVNYFTIS
ncbi:uncharacterized protein LOC132721631 isoform X3 [Ruditapes philippinarum]|uniref:uncharacterized protein LOC132721631 isoform X3 n=1 Tax=Ruditapes philippinarum TaxID=129788 RepID=UPI00295B4A56|nr:uncharacterized protein LOC132721631 isoform X3 [Ruditapes philippinarum]